MSRVIRTMVVVAALLVAAPACSAEQAAAPAPDPTPGASASTVPEQRTRDLDSVRALLSRDATKRWTALLRVRAEGASSSESDGLTLHDVRRVPAGYERADDGPYVFGTQVGPATAHAQGEALRLTFALDTGLVLEERGDDSGRHPLLPVTRTGSYVLVPNGDGWLIDDWEATFEHGEVRLVS